MARSNRNVRRSRAVAQTVQPVVPVTRPVGFLPVNFSGVTTVGTPFPIFPPVSAGASFRPTSIVLDVCATNSGGTIASGAFRVTAFSAGAEVVSSRDILVTDAQVLTVELRTPRSTQWSSGAPGSGQAAQWVITNVTGITFTVAGVARFSFTGAL